MQQKKVNKPSNPVKQNKTQLQKTKIIYSSNRNIYFYIALALSFLITLIFYLLTLAPTVSFEDSGELITAAYSFGVPHEPGYPLFAIFGKIFTILVPFGNIAYRVNMMSAFFTSLACLLITYSTVLIIEDTFINSKIIRLKDKKINNLQISKYLVGLGSGLFFGFSIETWKQAVMTEVYGINSCLVSLFILLALIWRRQETIENKRRFLYIISLVLALAVLAHMTSLMLIPIFGVFLLVVDYKILLSFKTILKTILYFILGLVPFLYLPIASLRNPMMNWGKPDNLTNFIRVVTRHQFRINEHQNSERFACQFKFLIIKLLPEQWFPVFLFFALIGLFIIFRYNKKYFWFVLTFLLFSMPIATWIINADISCNAEITDIVGGMASVFYIPGYLLLSVLIGVGFFYIISLLKIKTNVNKHFTEHRAQSIVHILLGIFFVVLALSNAFKNYKDADMSDYYYPEKYFNNTCKLATKNSIIMGDWDPYTFPFFYYQYVENKRKDIISIDISLLKRSWYIEWLKNYYPALIKKSKTEVDKFLNAVAPFENSEQYDGNIIQACYENMIYSFIDNNIKEGKDVYITYANVETQKVLSKYKKEPVYFAFKVQTDNLATKVDYTDFDFNDFIRNDNPTDGILIKFREYYGSLTLSRANMFFLMKNKNEALKNYNYALPFFANDTDAKNYIYQRINQLKSIN